nr:MAG TPA: hypothetical protein [Caudoviricetes sp.]
MLHFLLSSLFRPAVKRGFCFLPGFTTGRRCSGSSRAAGHHAGELPSRTT